MAAQLTPGTVVGDRFRIEALIGSGGMSTVYRARDEQLGRTIAVKVFPDTAIADHDSRRRESEVRLLASLDHPALVTLFDVIDSDDSTLVLMQFVSGEDLGQRLDSGAIPGPEVATIGATISSALASVHASDIIHRDIKPGNVLLPADPVLGAPRALLADFGIARLVDDTTLTAEGSIIGTAQYLSPEQARGGDVTTASDIYSLGLVLLESLTGTRVFAGSGIEAVTARLVRDPVIPPSLPSEWRSLLQEMTARDPLARPTATEAAARLTALIAVEFGLTADVTAPMDSAYAPTRRLTAVTAASATEVISAGNSVVTRRDRRPLVVVAAVVAALVIGGIATSAALSQSSGEVAPAAPTSATPTPSATVAPEPSAEPVTPVATPAPAETVVAPGPPGKDKPCKGNGKKKDC
jgi:serine/threonine protein kinase